MPSPPGRIYDGICADSCVIQEPLTLRAGPYMTTPSALKQRLHLEGPNVKLVASVIAL
jgi:hypothetical protein